MSKKKSRLYVTAEMDKEKNSIDINQAEIRKKVRNMVFVNMMRTCRCNVVQSKKNKPDKYPHNYRYED